MRRFYALNNDGKILATTLAQDADEAQANLRQEMARPGCELTHLAWVQAGRWVIEAGRQVSNARRS